MPIFYLWLFISFALDTTGVIVMSNKNVHLCQGCYMMLL